MSCCKSTRYPALFVLCFAILGAAADAEAATVAVLPIEGEMTEAMREQVAEDVRQALIGRADVVSTTEEVEREIARLGGIDLDLQGMSQLAEALDVEFILMVRVTPLPGQYRLELSAFRPDPPGIELLERVVVESRAAAEIRALLDELLTVTDAPAPPPPPVQPEVPEVPVEPEVPEAPAEPEEPEEPAEPEAPREPPRPRPEYGSRSLEISLAGGPTVLATDPGRGERVGGRISVGVGYAFYEPLGVGIRADLLAYFGNADAFGVTVGSGIHWAPFRGVPLYIGFRLGLGLVQSASGARATYFLLRPEPVIAYRIGQWVQLALCPANFSMLFGESTVIQYEALLQVAVTIGG